MTKLVGILNITPDSFSDGGKYTEIETALNHTKKLIKDGADIIDVGAESTRPCAIAVTNEEEWKRLKNILPKIIQYCHDHNVKVSLDSRHHQNIKKALDLGIDIINDVSGFESEEMSALAANSGKKIILMHNLGVPADKNKIIPQNKDTIEEILTWTKNKLKKLKKLGIKKEQIIFDPGVGFGKNSSQSVEIIQNISKLKTLELPILIGHSKKSFLDEIHDYQGNREEKTLQTSQLLIKDNVSYLRIHDVLNHKTLIS